MKFEEMKAKIQKWTVDPPFGEDDVDGNIDPTPTSRAIALALASELEGEWFVMPGGDADIVFEQQSGPGSIESIRVEASGSIHRTVVEDFKVIVNHTRPWFA